jgi:hypothetical protein
VCCTPGPSRRWKQRGWALTAWCAAWNWGSRCTCRCWTWRATNCCRTWPRTAADLAGSALHTLLSPGGGADAPRWNLLALDQAFGPGPDDVQALAALGALAARAGAPLLAAATPALAGAAQRADLAEPRRWAAEDDESLAYWQALRGAPMAPWLGLVLPRVLMRLPYGAATDPISAFAFEEMPAERPHDAYLWGGGAPALALLAGRAFQQDGWQMDLGAALDLEDLPSHVYTDDGERHQQPGAELLISEEAGQAPAGQRGLMPLLSWRQRNAARLLRWQSVASPARPCSRAWAERRRAGHELTQPTGSARGSHGPHVDLRAPGLVAREHQRRQVEAGPHAVADAGRAVDGHPLRLQVGHVAVHGAQRHLQPLGQEGRGGQPAPPHQLDDLKQAVGASHASIVVDRA